METLRLSPETTRQTASNAAHILASHGVVLLPTDTLYGLGADAFSNEAVDAIYRIKGRDEGKPIHALVSDLDMAARFCEITDDVRLLAEKLPKGKVTFICPKKTGIETGIARSIDTFGFRIPDNDFCRAMVEAFGGPVTATSANRAGMQPLRSTTGILEQLGDEARDLALVVDAGELPLSPPSTVISFAGDHPQILRAGAVPAAFVEAALRDLPAA